DRAVGAIRGALDDHASVDGGEIEVGALATEQAQHARALPPAEANAPAEEDAVASDGVGVGGPVGRDARGDRGDRAIVERLVGIEPQHPRLAAGPERGPPLPAEAVPPASRPPA